jgi:hypothetical protein
MSNDRERARESHRDAVNRFLTLGFDAEDAETMAWNWTPVDPLPPWKPTRDELLTALLEHRNEWLAGETSTYRVFGQHIIARLWDGARSLGGTSPPPPMPAPFPGPSSDPQEGSAAIDVLLCWLNELGARQTPGQHQTAELVPTTSKGVILRDEWALAQYEAAGTDTYHHPKKVADKWNAMKDRERAVICPTGAGRVSTAAIDKAIKRLRSARDGKAATPNASKHLPKQKRKVRKA